MKVVDEKTLDLFRGAGRCDVCNRTCQQRDPHHVWCKGIGSGSRLDVPVNLLSLCRSCHGKVHDGKIKRLVLLALIARREKLTVEEVVEKIWELLRRKK